MPVCTLLNTILTLTRLYLPPLHTPTSRCSYRRLERLSKWGYFLINMKNIFVPCPTNNCSSLILADRTDQRKMNEMHFKSLADTWISLIFELYSPKNAKVIAPDITYFVPCIAFRADLLEKIFPNPTENVEFLPIVVSGVNWLLINCLKSTSRLNEEKTSVNRGLNGEIFMINNLVIHDGFSEGTELFTVDGSNRAYTYVLDSFVDRVTTQKLRGLEFRKIGEVEYGES